MANDIGTTTIEARNMIPYNLSEPDFLKDVDLMEDFNTKRVLLTPNAVVKGIPHIFFTTPMMNMSKDNCNRVSSLLYIARSNPNLLSALNYGGRGEALQDSYFTSSPFIKLLSNTAISFEPKDSVSKTKETGETFYGYKLTLPAADVDSIVGDEISIKYNDLPGLPVLNLHKAWFDYHNGVRRGYIAPRHDAIQKRYIDYVSSIFYFVTDLDNETILYWCKFTGVAPLNVPYSSFSSEWHNRDIIEYTIQYTYSFKEDMDPDIFLDFNKLALYNFDLDINYKQNGESYIKTEKELVSNGSYDNMTPDKIMNLPTAFEDSAKKIPQIVMSNDEVTNTIKFKLKYSENPL